jgi:hypothetical protein
LKFLQNKDWKVGEVGLRRSAGQPATDGSGDAYCHIQEQLGLQ